MKYDKKYDNSCKITLYLQFLEHDFTTHSHLSKKFFYKTALKIKFHFLHIWYMLLSCAVPSSGCFCIEIVLLISN